MIQKTEKETKNGKRQTKAKKGRKRVLKGRKAKVHLNSADAEGRYGRSLTFCL